jgi:type IV pilus assembly protein PilF
VKFFVAAIISAAISAVVLSGCVSTSAIETKVPDQVVKSSDPLSRAQIHTERAAEYFRMGNLGVALEATRQAIAAAPNHAPAHNMLGIIYMQLKDDTQAAQAFEQALRLAPNDSEALNNYGWFICQRQNPASAAQYFQSALKNPLYATPERAHYNAGICLKKTGDMAAAEVQFRAAVQRQPLMSAALYELAEIELAKGRNKEAEGFLARHNQLIQMPSADALLLGARIARNQGDKSAESSYVQQLRRRFPDAAQTRAAIELR